MESYRTYSSAFLQRHRDTHARHPEFGTHEHPYLHDTMRQLAAEIAGEAGGPPSLLDYGCGKGSFLEAMRRLGVFGELAGFDPAIPDVAKRPEREFGIVTCFDILDQVEPRFVAAVISDVAQFARHRAVFNIVTKQAKGVTAKTESAFVWRQRIESSMQILSMRLHIAEVHDYAWAHAFGERAIFVARRAA